MNGKDIFLGLRYIGDDLVEKAEFAQFPAEGKNSTKKLLRRPLLVAAVIAMMLLLVGCAVVYMLSMKEVKMGEWQTSYDSFSFDPETGWPVEYLGKETVTEQILSFAGMKDTPAGQAAQEWFDFKQAYDPDGKIQGQVWGNEPEFPAEYGGYGLYTMEMKEQLDEIAEKYGLKLRGAMVPFRSHKQLLQAMGMETVLNSGSAGQMRIHQAEYFENGNLDLIFFLDVPGEAGTEAVENTFGCLYYRQKDCLIGDYAIMAEGTWREWNYKTSSGENVLIVRGDGSYTWVFCDTGTCTATLRLESDLTDRQAELVADAIDFSLEPRLLEGYETFDNGEVPFGEKINGYRVDLKTAKTDGYSVYIVMRITAPEGVDLEAKTAGTVDLLLKNTETDGFKGGVGPIDDGDDLPNTCDLLLQRSFSTKDGSPAITKDTVLNVYFEDIVEWYWDGREYETLVCEGVWTGDVTFGDSDFREIELLSQPIRAKACVGWQMDGTDVIEEFEVTSVKLRSLSIDLVSEDRTADFFSFNGVSSRAVMKDGSRVEIMNREFVKPIDLDQVDHILLADGTKIPVPAAEVQ